MTPAQIKSAREILGWSQSRAAKEFGDLDPRTIRRWEAGDSKRYSYAKQAYYRFLQSALPAILRKQAT